MWVAKYSDLTPNIGIFWYFFMEIFDRFIPYFLFVMHLHPVIYIVPIYLRLAYVFCVSMTASMIKYANACDISGIALKPTHVRWSEFSRFSRRTPPLVTLDFSSRC